MTQCLPTTCQACQNSMMDIRGIFTGGKKRKEKEKDNSSEKERPAEEGASARPLPPKQKFQQSWKSDFPLAIH